MQQFLLINAFWWLRKILMLWVRSKVVPTNPIAELKLDTGHPVCYVLRVRSFADLLVLYHYCEVYGLPLPRLAPNQLGKGGDAGYVYLQKLGWIQADRKKEPHPPSSLVDVVKSVSQPEGIDVQLVPVSIIWGRNPGKEEKSLFKLLFSEDENAGILQKLLIVFAQGRDTFINFGRPISVQRFVAEENLSLEDTTRKLRRILRVHFHLQRSATLGPVIDEPARVVHAVMQSPTVVDAIKSEAQRSNQSIDRVRARAVSHLREIAAIRYYSVIRFFDIVLSYIWNRIYNGVEVKNPDRLRDLAERYTLVYVPCHKSHMDYLLLPYMLYYLGFIPPYTVAGINLNFWPVGPLIRRAGAFFIRRKFHGNRLYAAVFAEYVSFLLGRGNSILFFPEGGRSRTGRLLQPRTGVLSMVLESCLKNPERPIALVPVYIGYDKIMEVKSYLRELRGLRKRKESLKDLIQARKILRIRHGRAYMNFGEIIDLHAMLDTAHPNWREETKSLGPGTRPAWFAGLTTKIAHENMRRINASAIMNPVSLLATALMSVPNHAMTEGDLVRVLEALKQLLKRTLVDRGNLDPLGPPNEILDQAERLAPVQRFHHPGGDVLYLGQNERYIMQYYRNMLMHFLAIPSLVASFFQFNDEMSQNHVIEGASELYPFLCNEFFLQVEGDTLRKKIEQCLTAMVELGLLHKQGEMLCRPPVTSSELLALGVVGRGLGNTLERYAILSVLLSQYAGRSVGRESIEDQGFQMAQRIAILTNVSDVDMATKEAFRTMVDSFLKLHLVELDAGGLLLVTRDVAKLTDRIISLLSQDVRDSIRRASGPIS